MILVTLQELDRTIYEAIRLKLVEKGHLPDITTFNNEAAYKSAVEAKGANFIDVIGVGFAESRGLKQSTSIVINRKSVAPSSLGAGTTFFTAKEGTGFVKKRRPAQAVNVGYELRVITRSTEMERKATTAVMEALKIKSYIPSVEDEEKLLLVNYGGEAIVTATDFMEKLLMYTFPDIWLSDTEEIVNPSVASLTEITVKVGTLDSTTPEVSSVVE